MGCDEKKLEELNLEKVIFEIFVQNATLSPGRHGGTKQEKEP
jgi:hypothetical protein